MRRRARLPFLVLGLAGLAAAAAPAAEPIRIGQYGAFSGKDADFGLAARKGVTLAVEEANAAGGVLGRPVELLLADNQSKPGESATIAKKFVARDRVVAVLGGNTSSNSLEAAPVFQHARVPMVAITSTSPAVTEAGDYIFRVCFIDSFQGLALAKFARHSLGLQRVALITSVNNPYSVGLSKVFREQFTAAGGTIVAEQRHSEGDKDFRAQITAIKAAGAEAILHSGNYTEGALICKQARELGFTGKFLGGDAWEGPDLVAIGGAAVEGAYYSTHASAETPTPAMQGFVRRYRARWDGETPNATTTLGYEAALLLFDAMRRAGSTDGPRVREALAATRDFPGVTGLITIDPQRNASKPAMIIQVRNGGFKFVEAIAP
ncbi:MAG TPA: ABC transporter substrate-binding protein [Lacunisphaera sp.]|nr:ABC transporter substrate-binding protein [Lacunisphaera sp.]